MKLDGKGENNRICENSFDSENNFVQSNSCDSYELLLKDILSKKLLTAEEEREIGYRILNGDNEAKKELIDSNLRLVLSIAKKRANSNNVLDLFQEGCLGLIKAVDKFDVRKGYKFSTYATRWIDSFICRAVLKSNIKLKVSHKAMYLSKNIFAYETSYFADNGVYPSLEEVADKFNCSIETVKEAKFCTEEFISLDSTLNDSTDVTFLEVTPNGQNSIEDVVIDEFFKDKLNKLINETLDDRERQIIRARFGYTDGSVHTLAEIGKTLGLTREGVRQIEAKALKKLRKPSNSKKLK